MQSYTTDLRYIGSLHLGLSQFALKYMKASESEWSNQRQRIQLAARNFCQEK